MTETRWLEADEQRVWRAYLGATQQLWERLGRDLEAASGLPMPEYEVLVRLSESPERALRMSELAQMLVHSRSRLTHTVARMERRGLVARQACPQDRRGVLCTLTEEGYRVLTEAAPGHVESVRRHLFDPLTPDEVAVLETALRKISDRLAQA